MPGPLFGFGNLTSFCMHYNDLGYQGNSTIYVNFLDSRSKSDPKGYIIKTELASYSISECAG